MRLRYYIDPATGEPHIYRHNVVEMKLKKFSPSRLKIELPPNAHESRWARPKLVGTYE